MTGPEHYREAQQQLDWVNATEPGANDEEVRVRLAMAQVHATLALAAATAEAFTPVDRSDRSWLGVIR